ncbi:MAG: alpha-mannosidase [Clostridia bacterium]|nr:alpha-mannosidase [Clostridia bacterium]
MGKKKHVHTIATAHLDTIWNWDFERTVKNYIPQTLNWNFHLFKKLPEYVFNFEGAYRYELMEEYYPEQFEKLKEYVAKGNWYPCGAGWENGDVNVPSPEALFRNFLLGNEYFNEKFDIRSRDVFLPDCFGFGYALPSIARHSNLYGFTTQKLSWGSAYGQPFDIGKWYGPDGKYIIASIKMHNYVAVLDNLRKNKAIKEKLAENEAHGMNFTEIFHGIGDRGGGPLPISIRNLRKNMKKNSKSDIVVHSSPSDKVFKQIMTEMTEADRDKLPSWNNEFLLTDHGTAGYTARAISKRWNRRGEELADMAERAAAAADWLGTAKYPQKELNTSWKRIINHQFHDDLPGTSVQRAYLRSWNDYGLSLNQLAHEYEKSVEAVASMLDTSFCKGIPVIVNNTMEFNRKSCVTATLDGEFRYVSVYDCRGNEIPSQISEIGKNQTTIAFVADMPPYSYCVFDVTVNEAPSAIKTELRASDKSLENERYTVTLNENGDIGSVYDKEIGKELLSSPVVLGIFDNYAGGWFYPAWEIKYKQSIRNHNRIARLVKSELIEEGPARCKIQVTQQCDDSVFINKISLSAGSDMVEVQCEFDWNSQRTLCKNIFSFACSNEEATFDLGLGAIKRGNAKPEIYEVPAQKWVDITDKSGEFGVSVLSDCKYGWDKFSDNTLRMTVILTPLNNSRPASVQSMMDLGLNRYGYAICAHKGDDISRVQMAAREFSSPMAAFAADKHTGILGSCYSFADISDNEIIIRAIKKAENTDEIVVRINEGSNKAHKNVKLSLGNGIVSAREIYASEEHIGDADVKDGSLVFDIKPYEVKSYALTLAPFESKEKSVSCSSVELPLNAKAFSSNQSRSGKGIHGKKYTIPSELVPDTISCGGVTFAISKSDNDSLLADGQTVALDSGYNKLIILCASLDGDKEYTFGIDGKPVKVTVSDIEERPFAWDLYGMKRTAKIKTDVLGWECTHTHSASGDNYAHQLFFFKYEIETNGAKSVTLPGDKNLLILAATQVRTGCECKCITGLYDTVEPREFGFRLKTLKSKLNYIYRKAIAYVWRIDDIGRIIYLHYRP